MATASIELPDGTKVSIDGSPEEIAKILSLYGSRTPGTDLVVARPYASSERLDRKVSGVRVTNGAMQYLRELIAESYFSERRSLSDVQHRLESLGRIFPVTHLSTPLRRLVMGRELRRLRDGRNWVYVGG